MGHGFPDWEWNASTPRCALTCGLRVGGWGRTFHVYYTAFTYHPRSELNLDRRLAEATCPQISQQRLSRPLWCLHTVSPTKLPTSHPSFRCSYRTLNPARLSQAWPAWYLATSESLPIQFLWFRKFPTPTHPNHQDQLKQHLLLEPYLISRQPPGWASSLLWPTQLSACTSGPLLS